MKRLQVFTHRKLEDYSLIVSDMDGTLYFQTPMNLCMLVEMIFYHIFHPWKIKDLLILFAFRSMRDDEEVIGREDFLRNQYSLTALKFSVEPEYVRYIVHKWAHDVPLKWMYLFRDRKLISALVQLRKTGVKIVVFSDYHAQEKVRKFGLEVDGTFSAFDPMISMLKPHRKGLDVIAETMDVSNEEILVIGDNYKKDGRLAENFRSDYIILKRTKVFRRRQLANIR